MVSSKAIPVLQLDKKTGAVLQQFESAYAAAKAINVPDGFGNINRVANGKAKSAYGFGWRYELAPKQVFADEEWKPFEDVHVSSYGRIRRTVNAGEVVHGPEAYKGKEPVTFIKNQRWPLYRLVAHVFLDVAADAKTRVDLKDGNPFNPMVTNIVLKEMKDVKEPKSTKRPRPVQQWTHDGKIMLNQFDSEAHAARALDIDRSHIGKCARGEEKTAKGFQFKFA